MRRRAVRVVVVDERENVLLLWHEWPHSDPHWAPPGGGVEDDESPESAATRELVEEVGLTGVVLGQPVWRWCHNFAFDGEPVEQDELIYVSRVEQTLIQGSAAHLAADGILDAQWWSLPELERCTDEVWPPGLARRVADVLGGRLDMAGLHLIA
jgi:8-oxo-dGTP pyrophosphatase MutT (NUDIX family)